MDSVVTLDGREVMILWRLCLELPFSQHGGVPTVSATGRWTKFRRSATQYRIVVCSKAHENLQGTSSTLSGVLMEIT